MFRRILITTDLTDGMYRLANFIPSLAAGGIEKIVFCHVVPFQEGREIPKVDADKAEAARDRLSVALENPPEGVEVSVEIPSGRPLDNIQKLAETHDIEAIVLGTNARTLLDEKLFGSTTAALSEQTKIPLLALRPPLISTYTCEELDLRCRHLFRYLMIPYDGSDAAKAALDRIITYAEKRPENSLQQCLLVRVVEVSRRREILSEGQVEESREMLAEAKSKLESIGLEVFTDVRQGEPLPEIMDMALEYDISAIAVSSTSLPKILDWSRSSFANKVLRQSWHPVLFFPPD